MSIQKRKLRLLSNNTSINAAVAFDTQYDSIFSVEAELRINNWLDSQNIIQQAPEEHFRDFFQNNKATAYNQINILINHQSFNSLPEIEIPSQSSSCSSCISSPGSLDLKRSPILNRRRINIGELLTNKSSSSSIPDSVQEFEC